MRNKRKGAKAVFILRLFNHATGEDFQIGAESDMIYKAQKPVEELYSALCAVYPNSIQILDFRRDWEYLDK